MSPRFDLPCELTIFTAAETRDAMLAWLAGVPHDEPLTVDADQVLDVDGAGLQLLCSLGALLDRQGRDWTLVRTGERLRQACTTLGLDPWLTSITGAVVDEARAPQPDTTPA